MTITISRIEQSFVSYMTATLAVLSCNESVTGSRREFKTPERTAAQPVPHELGGPHAQVL